MSDLVAICVSLKKDEHGCVGVSLPMQDGTHSSLRGTPAWFHNILVSAAEYLKEKWPEDVQ